MNCRKCGNLLNATDTVCHICGEPVSITNSNPNISFNQNIPLNSNNNQNIQPSPEVLNPLPNLSSSNSTANVELPNPLSNPANQNTEPNVEVLNSSSNLTNQSGTTNVSVTPLSFNPAIQNSEPNIEVLNSPSLSPNQNNELNYQSSSPSLNGQNNFFDINSQSVQNSQSVEISQNLQNNTNNQNLQNNINNPNNLTNLNNQNVNSSGPINNGNPVYSQNLNSNQVPPYIQEPINQQQPSQNVTFTPPSSNKNNLLFILAAILAIFIIGGLINKNVFLDKNPENNTQEKEDSSSNETEKEPSNNQNNDKNNNNQTNGNSQNKPADENNQTPPSTNNDNSSNNSQNGIIEKNPYKEYTIGHYKFTVLEELVYKSDSESIVVVNRKTNPSIVFNIYVMNFTYEQAVYSGDEIIAYVNKDGYATGKPSIVSYGGREFYTFAVSKDNQSGIYFISKIDNTACVCGLVVGRTQKDIETGFNSVNQILNTAKNVKDVSQAAHYPQDKNLQMFETFKRITTLLDLHIF